MSRPSRKTALAVALAVSNGVPAKQMAEVCLLLAFALSILAASMPSFAEGRSGTNAARASIDMRIIIPTVIRVDQVVQPRRVLVDEQHIAQGFIDLDAGSTVRVTSNNRNGYQLAASYDTQLLSRVEVRVASQFLSVSSGSGSIRVHSGLTVDKLIPISYRLYLAPGVREGEHRWPVALTFSSVSA